MNIFARFLNSKSTNSAQRPPHQPAGSGNNHRLSLQVVFDQPHRITADALTCCLHNFAPEMIRTRVKLAEDTTGLIGWDEHRIQLKGFQFPLPKENLEICVQPAHYASSIKDRIRQHQSHLVLRYSGSAQSPIEQYTALAATAFSLHPLGAVAVLNGNSHTSLPTLIFSDKRKTRQHYQLLRTMPLTALYMGFVKYEIENIPGVWMRTYGGHIIHLPDFAIHAHSHDEASTYSVMFDNICHYLLESGARTEAGHTMQIEGDLFIRLRAPAADEYYLHGPGHTLVAELIAANEINQ